MSFTIDLPTLAMIVIATLGAFAWCLKALRANDLKRIAGVEKELRDLMKEAGAAAAAAERIGKLECSFKEKDKEIADLQKQEALGEKSIQYAEGNLKALESKCQKLGEELADARETIIGFGRDFVTRKEYIESHQSRRKGEDQR